MHFLITQNQHDHRLLHYSDHILDLQEKLLESKERQADRTPVILSSKMVREIYLCDDFGVPVQDEEGMLIKLDDL